MKDGFKIISGLVLTVLIYLFSTFIAVYLPVKSKFIPVSFYTQISMMLLSMVFIFLYSRKTRGFFMIKLPKLKYLAISVFTAIILLILFQVLASAFFSIASSFLPDSGNPAAVAPDSPSQLSLIQAFIFVFITASFCEELLFRGFLQNTLKPLAEKGISFLKIRLSLPVLISGALFGLGHLILFSSGASPFFVLMIVAYAIILGICAGYFQEKYNNFIYAFIVHATGNIPLLLGALSA